MHCEASDADSHLEPLPPVLLSTLEKALPTPDLAAPLPQVLDITEQPGGLAAQLHSLHRFPLAATLSFHCHLCPAGHAALWRQIRL